MGNKRIEKHNTMKDYKKLYEDAIERAKYALTTDMDESGHWAVKHIFPEITENEDERIKRVLVEFFKSYKEQNTCGAETFNGIPTNNILSWLEKQGEKSQGKTALEAINEEVVDNANKVEPKFKVGDFIKHNKANIICKVVSVNNGSYYVNNIETDSNIELFNAEQNFHLLTIEDAKEW